jgi:hypothetical protein
VLVVTLLKENSMFAVSFSSLVVDKENVTLSIVSPRLEEEEEEKFSSKEEGNDIFLYPVPTIVGMKEKLSSFIEVKEEGTKLILRCVLILPLNEERLNSSVSLTSFLENKVHSGET